MKCDVTNRTSKIWSEDHCLPSEPVFVPRPNAESEDDGEKKTEKFPQNKLSHDHLNCPTIHQMVMATS